MRTQNQIPLQTKVLMAIMAALALLLVSLILMRAWGWLRPDLFRMLASWKNEDSLATMTLQTQFTTAELHTPIPTLTTVPTETREPAFVVALANINVRSGPGLTYEKVGVLENESEAVILGKDPEGYWWAIAFPAAPGGQGWVARDYVVARRAAEVPVIEPPQPEEAQVIPLPLAGKPAVKALGLLNIRAGPGQNFTLLGQLQPEQRAEVVGVSVDGKWYAIRMTTAPNGHGWVAAQYVLAENVSQAPVLQE